MRRWVLLSSSYLQVCGCLEVSAWRQGDPWMFLTQEVQVGGTQFSVFNRALWVVQKSSRVWYQ